MQSFPEFTVPSILISFRLIKLLLETLKLLALDYVLCTDLLFSTHFPTCSQN